MDIPELRVENLRVDDPVNAHHPASPANQPELQRPTHQLSGPHSRPPLPEVEDEQRFQPRTVEQRLNLRLRDELPWSVGGTQWPIAQPHILQGILTSDEILLLLREYQSNGRLSRNENVESLCRKLCGHDHPSCIVILAMLILVDKGYTLGKMLHDQVSDDTLPLEVKYPANPVLFSWDHVRNNWRRLSCFDDDTWGVQAKLDICKWQWHLRVPHMKVSGPSFEAYEGKFGPDTVLPWTSKSKDGEVMKHDRITGYGGYSAVYKCHIDDRFHGFHEILTKIGLGDGRGFFALKVLNTYTADEKAKISNLFQNERRQLNRFNGVAHNHLVTLLAAFEQENTDKNFFVFPWAECDLSAFWEKQKPGDVKWVSEQLKGLVSALNEIHNPAQNSQNLGTQVFGRHGDLKPDNILWYTPYKGDPKGILVVSDMGFTAVNSELSRSKQTNGKPRTPTYRPPELDIQGEKVTREYDVWPLGCIFLEMITWLLGGHPLNIKFKERRSTVEDENGVKTTDEVKTTSGVKTPIFFTFDEGQAIVKPEVTEWFDELRSHERSTEFIRDVLRIVQDKMIIARADRRGKARSLEVEFDRINNNCEERVSYYTPSSDLAQIDRRNDRRRT